MTYWEAFTQAKDRTNPDRNEDRLVVVDDRLAAVIDGATDKSGATYGGLTGGQIAGGIVEDVLRAFACKSQGSGFPPVATILSRINARLASRYRVLGISDAIRNDPWRRFSAQATIAIRLDAAYRFIVIGDTGLRLNGQESFSGPMPADVICAQIRVAVHRFLTEAGASAATARLWARTYTVEGLGAVLPRGPAEIGEKDLERFRKSARRHSHERLAHLAARDIDQVLMSGLKGLHRYRNRPGPLGFAAIDGTKVPPQMIVEFERAAKDVDCIELFSDGYPRPPGGTTVADWEAGFFELERDDPERIGPCPETKGSTQENFADDRTVLIVRPWAKNTN